MEHVKGSSASGSEASTAASSVPLADKRPESLLPVPSPKPTDGKSADPNSGGDSKPVDPKSEPICKEPKPDEAKSASPQLTGPSFQAEMPTEAKAKVTGPSFEAEMPTEAMAKVTGPSFEAEMPTEAMAKVAELDLQSPVGDPKPHKPSFVKKSPQSLPPRFDAAGTCHNP